MKLHEWWRHGYRQRRYLEHATSEEIKQRFQDVMDNICYFDSGGRIVMKHPAKDGEWIVLFTHVLEELALRGEAVTPDLMNGSHFDGWQYHNCRRAAEFWRPYDLPMGTYLLKFGKLQHLRPLFQIGSLRVAPASYYQQSSLNLSIRDSELEFTQQLYDAKIQHPPNGDYSVPRAEWIDMPTIGYVKLTTRSPSDYYIACFSAIYEFRLYDDFEADGCLVIKDVPRFVTNLRNRMEEGAGM